MSIFKKGLGGDFPKNEPKAPIVVGYKTRHGDDRYAAETLETQNPQSSDRSFEHLTTLNAAQAETFFRISGHEEALRARVQAATLVLNKKYLAGLTPLQRENLDRLMQDKQWTCALRNPHILALLTKQKPR